MKRSVYKAGIILGALLLGLLASEAYSFYERYKEMEIRLKEIEERNPRIDFNKADVDCLAKNIYNEARGQSYLGKVAVAQVTLNRLNKNNWGNSICSVVMSHGQFSWTLLKRKRKYAGEEWESSLQVANDVLVDNIRFIGLENATYYHSGTKKPYWVKSVNYIAKIDDHMFYSKK
jgi:spore germination cell wall hydrolase CwlJ-like protein